jgi:hypothetical protein
MASVEQLLAPPSFTFNMSAPKVEAVSASFDHLGIKFDSDDNFAAHITLDPYLG